MRYIINFLFVAVLASSGALLFSTDVKAQGCTVFIEVDTIPESSTEFPYTVVGNTPEEFSLNPASISEKFFLPLDDTMTVTQGPVEGWVLRDVSCSGLIRREVGEAEAEFIPIFGHIVSITKVDSGADITCIGSGTTTCTFINSRTETIPTISQWGVVALVLGLGAVGFFVIRRRQVTA